MAGGWNRPGRDILVAAALVAAAPPAAGAETTSWGRIKALHAETPVRVAVGIYTAEVDPRARVAVVRAPGGRVAARAWRDREDRIRVALNGHAVRAGALIGDLSASLCGAVASRVEEKCAVAAGPSPWGQVGCLLLSAATFALCMTLDDIMAIEPPPNQGGYGLGTPPVYSGPGTRR